MQSVKSGQGEMAHKSLRNNSGILVSIEGKEGEIDAQALAVVLTNFLGYLKDLDRGLSGNPDGSIDWKISDLRTGSLVYEVKPVERQEGSSLGQDVVRLGVAGLNRIQNEVLSPEYSSLLGMNKAKKMIEVIDRYGATGLYVANQFEDTQLTRQAALNIAALTKPRRTSIGSVEGVLEMITLHRKPQFTVYSSVTHKGVSCYFVPSLYLNQIKDNLGNRINVQGTIRSNMKGEPLSINVEHIRTLMSLDDFTRGFTLKGMSTRFTGAKTSEKYVEGLRDA